MTVGMLIGLVILVAVGVWGFAHWYNQQQVEGVTLQHHHEQMQARLSGKRAKARLLAEQALKYYKEKHPQPYMVQRAFFALIDVQDNESIDLIKHLLDTKLVQIDALNDHGQTALFYVALHGNVELTKVLLEHGANPNAYSEDGAQLPLNGALIKPDVVRLLLQQDANPNLQMEEGVTVLMNVFKVLQKASISRDPQATIEKCKKIIDFLLAYGASATIEDKHGKSAMDRLKNLKEFYLDTKVINPRFSEQDRQNMLILCKEIEIEFQSRGKVTS